MPGRIAVDSALFESDGYSFALRFQDPHELASWVNQIDGYSVRSPLFRTPTSWPRG